MLRLCVVQHLCVLRGWNEKSNPDGTKKQRDEKKMKKRCYDHFCDVEVDTTLYGSLGFIPQFSKEAVPLFDFRTEGFFRFFIFCMFQG